MNLKEFDFVIDRMKLAFEGAKNLGQPIEQAKILYQMNGLLPVSLQINLDDLEDEGSLKQSILSCQNQVNSRISEYREQLMLC
jgi:hypothetical protein